MSKRSIVFTVAGVLLLVCAVGLTAFNFWSDCKAGGDAAEALTEICKSLPSSGENTPDYLLNPDMEMPVKEINGYDYIGILSVPDLDLELPVIGRWSDSALKKAPCRYSGSVYQNNMVIAAHNYSRHFGRLKRLSLGAEVLFTDMDGNVFRFRVGSMEVLSPKAIEEMTESDWDLTLFTCTVGGRARVALRCERIENDRVAVSDLYKDESKGK